MFKKKEAERQKVDEGRSNLNHRTFLPEPARFDLGLNPTDLMEEMFGENFIKKFIFYGIIAFIGLILLS